MRRRIEQSGVAEELWPGVSQELLKALHILTHDGALNADSRRKLKQVKHPTGLLRPALEDLRARHEHPTVVDCGAGKAYFGFLLAQAHLADSGHVISIEERPELVERCRAIAKEAGLQSTSFINAKVESYSTQERIHLVTALHACDTATDDALFLGIRHQADYIAVVPCCQAEVARQLSGTQAHPSAMHALFGEPLHRREFGSHLTNVTRALTLRAHGYQVTVTELTGWEHSLKNEIILAKRVQRHHQASSDMLAELIVTFGIDPKLQRLLRADQAASRVDLGPLGS